MNDREDVHVHFTHIICTSGTIKVYIVAYLSDKTE